MFSLNVSDHNAGDRNEFESQFNNQFLAFIKLITMDLEQLIANIDNFINTSVLKVLLSLQINTYFLSLNYFGDRYVWLPYDIFQILTKDRTAVQKYLSFNCSKMSSTGDIPIHFG